MQKGSSQSIKPHLISEVKRQIARLHTLISEKV
jgi:ribosomal protein L29